MINGQIVWFEIPVKNLDNPMHFYSEVLSIKLKKMKFLDQEYCVFNKDESGVKGVLVVKENIRSGPGIILFFYVVDMSESLKSAIKLGGKILTEKTLIKQKTNEGEISITSNLIDGNVGYYSEFNDCDGNQICLYSNS